MLKKWEVLIREAERIQAKCIVEIGCCPFPLDAPLAECYGLSTLKLGQWAMENNAVLYSCDINPDSVANAQKIVQDNKIHGVMLECLDGAEYLNRFPQQIDLLYLDNGGPDVTLEQFKIAENRMSPKGVIILDDAHTDSDGLFSKGTTTIPYAISQDYDIQLLPAYGSIMAIIKRKEVQ